MNKKWICVCGKENETDFCEACGTARPGLLDDNNDYREDAGDGEGIKEENNQNVALDKREIDPQKYYNKKVNTDNKKYEVSTNKIEGNDAIVIDKNKRFKRKIIVCSLIAVFLLIVGISFSKYNPNLSSHANSNVSTKNNIDKNNTNNDEIVRDKSAKEKNHTSYKSELSLGGLELDETMHDMYNKLGQESYTKSSDGKTYYYYKDSIRVGFTDGKITSLVSDGANASTKRGIHEGSTLKEVINYYGDSSTKFTYDGLELYEYSAKSLDGRDGILRFAINSQGKVEYISVRIPQEAKVDTQALRKAAKDVVVSYHKHITNKDYKVAYNLLTPDMQNTMGLYDNWAKGFSSTIESRAENIQITNVQGERVEVSFILVARDRQSGGGVEENRFRSTATVVKTGNGWKIAEVNNKKI